MKPSRPEAASSSVRNVVVEKSGQAHSGLPPSRDLVTPLDYFDGVLHYVRAFLNTMNRFSGRKWLINRAIFIRRGELIVDSALDGSLECVAKTKNLNDQHQAPNIVMKPPFARR